MAAVPPASASSISSASVPIQTQSSASVSRSSSSSVASVSVSRPVSVSSASSTSIISSSSSISPSASRPASSSTAAVVNGASNAHNDSPSQNNNITVIVPIAVIACALVIIYFAYRLYLLHKRRKDESAPLPPPRTPAILEQGNNRQSVMYSNPQAPPASLSYRNSMRPTSFIYASGHSSTSSNSLYKAPYTPGSGHSTPTGPTLTFYTDESGRVSPFPPPSSMRSHSRPHSVASFTSARHSSYGTSPLRGPSYLNRVDIVLPRPLSVQGGPPPPPSATNSYRHSTYTPDSRSPLSAPILPPLSSTSSSREEDWTGRVAAAAAEEDAESTSTCTAPPVPSKQLNQRGMAPSPSLDPHVPGAFPPSVRGRSMSPPEPLLSSNAFVGSTSGSGSDESRK